MEVLLCGQQQIVFLRIVPRRRCCWSAQMALSQWSDVNAFLQEKISFQAISRVVRSVLDKNWNHKIKSFDDVFTADNEARKYTAELI